MSNLEPIKPPKSVIIALVALLIGIVLSLIIPSINVAEGGSPLPGAFTRQLLFAMVNIFIGYKIYHRSYWARKLFIFFFFAYVSLMIMIYTPTSRPVLTVGGEPLQFNNLVLMGYAPYAVAVYFLFKDEAKNWFIRKK